MGQQSGHFPARILERQLTTERLTGVDLPDGVDAFIFPAEISSDRLDAFFTHMAESTLRNFATDSARGVALLDSHNARNLGFGQSLAGVFEVEDEVSRVVSDFYTIPGIRFGGSLTYESTDDFIKAVKARLVRDVSVGFYGGDMICDICGNSFYDWMACSHWPGEEYAIGDQGKEKVIATFTVEDARLAEVSVVYDGATPGAMIMRATEMAEAGKLSPEMTRRLEVKYRIKLPGEKHNWPGVEINSKGDKDPKGLRTMTEPKQEFKKPPTSIRDILQEAKAPEGPELEGVEWLSHQLLHARSDVQTLENSITKLKEQGQVDADTNAQVVARLNEEIQRLQPMADEGQEYRAILINETLIEGVRALGENFPEETYRGILENATTEAIRKILETFAGKAKSRFIGGRQTVDDDKKQTDQKPVPATPDLAYAG